MPNRKPIVPAVETARAARQNNTSEKITQQKRKQKNKCLLKKKEKKARNGKEQNQCGNIKVGSRGPLRTQDIMKCDTVPP